MLRFFRQIRHRLLSENRFTKYLFYAIGEILLVVIGILIALQVNNWNEQRLEAALIKAQLSDLAQNLKSDRPALEEMRSFHALRVHSAAYILRQYGLIEVAIPFPEAGPEPRLDASGFYGGPIPEGPDRAFTIRAFSWLVRNNHAAPNTNAIEEFKNTGLFAKMKNAELKSSIQNYYTRYGWVFPPEERNLNPSVTFQETLASLGYSYIDVNVLEDPVEELLSYATIRALLKNIIDRSTFKSNQASNLLEQLDELIREVVHNTNSAPQ